MKIFYGHGLAFWYRFIIQHTVGCFFGQTTGQFRSKALAARVFDDVTQRIFTETFGRVEHFNGIGDTVGRYDHC